MQSKILNYFDSQLEKKLFENDIFFLNYRSWNENIDIIFKIYTITVFDVV